MFKLAACCLRSNVCVRARYCVALAAIASVAIASTGCETARSPGQAGTQASANGQWPFRPASIRVHPLTRLQTRDGKAVLETWVQLLDRDGYPVRGLGTLSISLENAGPGYMHQYAWTVELESSADADVRFDPVAHGYMLLLGVDANTLPTRPRVHAMLQTPQGDRFTNRLALDEPAAP
jgi:hypothetical protein